MPKLSATVRVGDTELAMNAASELIQSLKDFGWPILAYAIFASISTFVLPSVRSREERVQRLLFVGIIIAFIEGFFFVGTESNDALHVASLHKAWGIYMLLLILLGFGAAMRWVALWKKEDRKTISISLGPGTDESSKQPPRISLLALFGLWLMGIAVAVIWLLRIAVKG